MKKANHHRLRKDIEEKVTIQEFLREKKLFEGNNITYPNPPDAFIVPKAGRELWVEETCIYRHWKREVSYNYWEYECPNNSNDYQIEFIQNVIERINAKNNNNEYKPLTKKYGKGILLLRIADPCFRWQIDLNKVKNKDNYQNLELNYFRCIYLYSRPLIIEQTSSNPPVWQPKILPNHDSFHLLCGQELEAE